MSPTRRATPPDPVTLLVQSTGRPVGNAAYAPEGVPAPAKLRRQQHDELRSSTRCLRVPFVGAETKLTPSSASAAVRSERWNAGGGTTRTTCLITPLRGRTRHSSVCQMGRSLAGALDLSECRVSPAPDARHRPPRQSFHSPRRIGCSSHASGI